MFGRRQDTVFLELKALLEPFGITRYFTDGWGAYERHLAAAQQQVGKANTQKIESKHMNLRTRIKRLVRRTLCFSKTEHMHDLVIGLFINRYEGGFSNVDIDGNNTLHIKGIGVTISTFETLPQRGWALLRT